MNNPINSTYGAAVKKRLNKVFRECSFILIWASFKPDQWASSTTGSGVSAPAPAQDHPPSPSANLPVAFNTKEQSVVVGAPGFKSSTIEEGMHFQSLVTLPKTALNDYCSNINLPIVGSAIDLLSVTARRLATPPPGGANSTGPLLSLVAREKPLPRKTLPGTFLSGKSCLHPLEKITRTHQVAEFTEQVLSTRDGAGFQPKNHSNQLLGAFVKASNQSFFIGLGEIKQSILLQQSLKIAFSGFSTPVPLRRTPPAQDLVKLVEKKTSDGKQITRRTFEEITNRLSGTYKGHTKTITGLLKNLIFIINRPQIKLTRSLSTESSNRQKKRL